MYSMLDTIPSLILAAGDHAAGGHHDTSINWLQMLALVANAVIFFGFLAYKLIPMAKNGAKKRREDMEAELKKAQAQAAEAEARAEAYKVKLANLESEVQRIVDGYETEARAESERMEQETQRAIERLARDSDNTVRQEFLKAEARIREAAVQATLEVAEKIVRDRINDADRQRLAEEYISKLTAA